MEKSTKKIIIISLFFVCFFFVKNVKADQLYSQEGIDNSYNWYTGSSNDAYWYEPANTSGVIFQKNSFYTVTQPITGIRLKTYSATCPNGIGIRTTEGGTLGDSYTSNQTPTVSAGNCDYTITSTSSIPVGKHIYAIQGANTSVGGQTLRGSTSNGGNIFKTSQALLGSGGIAFYLFSGNTFFSALTLDNPNNGDSFGGMSIQFRYDYYDPLGAYDYAVFEINNTNDGYSFFQFDKITATTASSTITKYFTKPITPGSWRWQGYLLNSSSLSSTTPTSWNNFTFASSSVTDIGKIIDEKTQEDLCTGLDLDTTLGQIECAIRRAFYRLVYPSQSSLTAFSGSADDLKRSFPFSAYFDITNTMTTAVSSSTTSMDNTIGLPFIRKTATSSEYYILPVLSSSSVPNLIGEENNSLFRDSIGWLLWASAIVFIIFRLTK